MDTKERLREAYDYLRSQGKAHTQIDVARAMNASASNVSSAFKGDERCLTDRFLMRFNKAFDYLFNEDWLLNGEGEMLQSPVIQQTGDIGGSATNVNVYNSPSVLQNALAEQTQITKKAQEQIDRLLAIIEKMQG